MTAVGLRGRGVDLVYTPAVKLYGISEIAQAIGAERKTVSQWYARGKLPPPTEVLAAGPVWTAKAIEPILRDGGPAPRAAGRPRRAESAP